MGHRRDDTNVEWLGVAAVHRIAGAEQAPVQILDLAAHELPRVVPLAEAALGVQPVSITAVTNPRSPGGRHDFSSEGDYWWPDPRNPDGPYIRRDGEVIHRFGRFPFRNEALGRVSSAEEKDFVENGGYRTVVEALKKPG